MKRSKSLADPVRDETGDGKRQDEFRGSKTVAMVQTGCKYKTFPNSYEDEAGCEAGGGWSEVELGGLTCRKRLEATVLIFRF